MRLRIVHETSYEYDEPVTTSHHEIHLTPRKREGQACISHDIAITPAPSVMRERFDYFDNPTRYFSVHEPHRKLRIVAHTELALTERPSGVPSATLSWEEVRDAVALDRHRDMLDAYSFVFDSPYVAASADLRELGRVSFTKGRPLIEAVTDLTSRIFHEFTYDATATRVSTPLQEVLRHRRGVCQDFAHLQIGCLRSLGLPGRYVSGYLLTKPRPGQSRLVGADASHAWVSTYLPGSGWVDFDPANNLVQPKTHVTLAYGRDFGDVSPLRGVILGGGRHDLQVAVDVRPIDE